MKRRNIMLLAIIGGMGVACLGLSGCSTTTTTLYPQSNNTYQVVSLSRSQGSGVNASMAKATKVCKAQGKTMVVLKHKSYYRGNNKELGEASKVVSDTVFAATGNFIPSMQQNNDYKSILRFKCKG